MKAHHLSLTLILASAAATAAPPVKDVQPILLASNLHLTAIAISSTPAIVPTSRADRVLAETLGVVSAELAAQLEARYGLVSDPLTF